MSLPNWQRNGWLTAHKSSVSEVRDLFGVIERDLNDSGIDEISADARLGMAYNAALKEKVFEKMPWDVYGVTADNFLELLPKEFSKFREA